MLGKFEMVHLPIYFPLIGLLIGAVLFSVVMFRRSGRNVETDRLELVMSEVYRQIKSLQSNPKSIGFERVRSLLQEVQIRLYSLPPELTARYENRVMKILHEAARLGITSTPENALKPK
jgi:hypothetical protein